MISEKPLAQNTRITLLTQGKLADGRDYWAYVAMEGERAIAFRAAQSSLSGFKLQAYGEVLEWGVGAEVPSDVRARMEREHGVTHRLEELLTGFSPE